MYMQEALEMVCRRRKLQANEYALLLSDMSILIPLDRTVASLQGKSDLMLVKRTMLPHLNLDVRPFGRSTDPNGALFSPHPCETHIVTSRVTQLRFSSACPTLPTWTSTLRKTLPRRTKYSAFKWFPARPSLICRF